MQLSCILSHFYFETGSHEITKFSRLKIQFVTLPPQPSTVPGLRMGVTRPGFERSFLVILGKEAHFLLSLISDMALVNMVPKMPRATRWCRCPLHSGLLSNK